MNNRDKAVQYLEELENMLVRIDTEKKYEYTDVLASLRSGYWLFREYLRLEERVKKLEEKR